jgi:hypothetical protein
MAKKGKRGKGRKGAVKSRAQVLNPRTGRWVKIDTEKGGIISQKKSRGPYKGVRKYKKKRR